mgnify:CR=1 FL=1
MSMNYAYNFAEVDDATGMCVGFLSTSDPSNEGSTGNGTTYILVPVNDPEYIFKYYINGNWYEDAEGTIPWQSSLL